MRKTLHSLLHNLVWVKGTVIGSVCLGISCVTSILANRYASRVMGSAVGDLLLDHLPLYDVNTAHIYAASVFWVGILVFFLRHPAYLPFTLKTTSVFLVVRAFFVVLTHLGPPPNLLQIPSDFTALYIYQGDLFFSGHVGGPFLFALILQKHSLARWVCVLASIFFAAIVLLGRLHYSIDVFAAFFIAHSVYTLMWKTCMDRKFFDAMC